MIENKMRLIIKWFNWNDELVFMQFKLAEQSCESNISFLFSFLFCLPHTIFLSSVFSSMHHSFLIFSLLIFSFHLSNLFYSYIGVELSDTHVRQAFYQGVLSNNLNAAPVKCVLWHYMFILLSNHLAQQNRKLN